ncbi:MAG TPA: DUF364 domain-containing protein [Chitinispirillaceae bacterium]|nr:DUF364 domain-containing protein [Chitinispirillaceae bacterium]
MEQHIYQTILSSITDYSSIIEEVHLFEHWIVIKAAGRYEMSTRFSPLDGYSEQSSDSWLGNLPGQNAAQIAKEYLASDNVLHVAAGMASLKCVLPHIDQVFENSAMDHFAELTKTHTSCVIGHFKDAAQWRSEGRPVSIIELKPRDQDIHWNNSHEALSKAEIIFMTGLTLVNGTFGEVIKRTPSARYRIIMGPTVPLTPSLFSLGLHWLGTSRIIDSEKALRYFGMGGGSVMYAPEGALHKVNIGNIQPT